MTSGPQRSDDEADAVKNRYSRRIAAVDARRYSMLDPAAMLGLQERQRATLRLFTRLGLKSLANLRLVEVGSGVGGNLIDFLRMGFYPEHLTGIELLPERVAQARRVLPKEVHLRTGDAASAQIADASLDIVFQAVVFSSILDDNFQQQLANAMWRWTKRGGGVLWYDFVYDNPSNPDVRGVPLRRVRELFPEGRVNASRVTLAPPIARRVTAWHPVLYTLFNALPVLRTHVLCWIEKP
jgi:SAM-dependent methyltransferase